MADRTDIIIQSIDRGFSAVSVAAKWGSLAFIALQAKDAAVALAGQKTEASFIVAYLTETGQGTTVSFPLLVVVLTTIWAVVERKLRHSVIQRLTERTKALEQMINATRTTSGLTPKGNTHPHDR